MRLWQSNDRFDDTFLALCFVGFMHVIDQVHGCDTTLLRRFLSLPYFLGGSSAGPLLLTTSG
jgi:hypothetical protein